jgi:hypothetical protein|nr:DUF2631 domain-containing protein [Actinoplanes friuliensis]
MNGLLSSAPQEDRVVAEEPVYAPDQLKPGNRKWARIGAVGTAAIMLLMLWGNHEGNTENIWLIGTAVALIGVVLVDVVLRRNGLKPNDQ